ncbi:MAG: VOC family protein [Pseudomonadales bacterium]|jgi:catechol 2,3-dioxygenase
MALSWSHALFMVENYDEMVSFYTEVLGFEVTDTGTIGEATVAFMSQNAEDHHQIAMVSGKPPDSPAPAVNHFAFRTESLTEVKAWFARLSAEDRVAGVAPITHGNTWSVYFQDPEGNGIEVFCDSPWHVSQPAGEGWDPAADDESIIAATREKFAADPEFKPIEEFYSNRAAHLAERTAG